MTKPVVVEGSMLNHCDPRKGGSRHRVAADWPELAAIVPAAQMEEGGVAEDSQPNHRQLPTKPTHAKVADLLISRDSVSAHELPSLTAIWIDHASERLFDAVAASRRICVLTGAGCSTASGIPDYRDTDGAWKRDPPMRFQDFTSGVPARQRYWARSAVGYRQFSRVAPNAAHHALAQLEHDARLEGLITQNVDGLHQRAGSRNVIDLHGRIDAVVCLQCQARIERSEFQRRLEYLNPHWRDRTAIMAPDGDALLEDDFSSFRIPPCEVCEGVLKPDVVFFGEAVPADRVNAARAMVETCDLLLVAGSSLMVYSGFRFIRIAREAGATIAVINLGRTRADDEVDIKVAADCAVLLPQLVSQLAARN
jgi:NAD-dependent SIR2 family protein deacetylase